MTQNISIRVVLALTALALGSFAVVTQAHAATTECSFSRNLGTGSTGSDVQMLQKFLNETPDTRLAAAGAGSPGMETTYYGSVTANAVSRFQVKYRSDILTPVGLTNPTGYFGDSTRAKANELCAGDDENIDDEDDDGDDEDVDNGDDDEDDDGNEKDEAASAIDNTRDNLADARQDFEDAEDNGDDTGDAEDLLDDAEALLDDADDAFDDEDYDEAGDLADDAQDLIDEALDDIDSEEDSVGDDAEVDTSAEVAERSGSDNDSARFEIEFTLTSFNQDAFFDQDTSVSVNYEIQDADGNDVAGATSLSATLQSSADEEDEYFVIDEGEEEDFTLTVSFDPLAADEGEYYRLQLVSMEFNDSEAAPDQTWTASPEKKFRTDYVHIDD